MVGHTHDDVDQIFSKIATRLKKIQINCLDQQRLFAEMRNAFKEEKDKPDVREMFCPDFFDYDKLFMGVLDQHLAGY
jgi:hypothetical protein